MGQRSISSVWIDHAGQNPKIAQVGIKFSQWLTIHGFALNVNMNLSGFNRTVHCGITDCQVCNLNQFAPDVRIEQVKNAIAQTFAEIFDLDMQISFDSSQHIHVHL